MCIRDRFTPLVTENAIAYTKYFTQLLGVGSNADKYKNYVDKPHVIISLPGELQQSFHQDTNKHDHIIMIHAITRRYIWIRDDRGDHYKVLQSGDVLMFHGDCCYTGEANNSKRSSIAMYVPVGFWPTNTFNYPLRDSNL